MADDEEKELAEMLDLTKKKKKKKKKDKKEKETAAAAAGDEEDRFAEQRRRMVELEAALDGGAADGDPLDRRADYSYEDMLDRVMGILHAQNPDLIAKKRRTMKPPQVQRVSLCPFVS